MRMLGDGFGEQAALVEAHVSRRRADQARHRVPLHVLGHVEADELDAHRDGELARDLGLADARGTGEQETADRFALIAQARARHLDGGRQRIDGLVLAVDDQLEIALEIAQHFPVRLRHALGRNARHARDHVFDVPHLDRRFAFVDRLQAQARARLVDHVDGLVGHVPFVDVARGELRRGANRIVRIRDAVMLLEARLQPHEDVDGLGHRRLDHVDLLEATRQRVILLEDAAVFLVGGRTDAAQLAVGEHRLDEVRGVHDAARSRAGADHGVDLVDEQDGARLLLQLGDHALEALLEIAAILGARDQRAHVERIDSAVGQHVGDLALDDHARQAFGNRRLADAGLADVQRIVLAAPAQDLDGAFHLERAADQRIDLAVLRELVEIGGVLVERAAAFAVAIGLRRRFLPWRSSPRRSSTGRARRN